MKNIHIPEPCGENFHLMPATERGKFCAKCATDTYDFKNKTNDEIRAILKANIGQKVCGQFSKDQLEKLNQEFEEWTFTSTKSFQSGFLFALIAVFGLSLFSCTEKQHEIEILSFQQSTKNIIADLQPENITSKADQEMLAGFIAPDIQFMQIETDILGVLDSGYNEIVQVEPPTLIEPDIYEIVAGGVGYNIEYIDYLEQTVPEEYDAEGNLIPSKFSSLVFPNPMTSNGTLELKLPSAAQYKIDIYDLNGKFIHPIFEGNIERGTFRQPINLVDVPSGMYLITILSENYKETIRVVKN